MKSNIGGCLPSIFDMEAFVKISHDVQCICPISFLVNLSKYSIFLFRVTFMKTLSCVGQSTSVLVLLPSQCNQQQQQRPSCSPIIRHQTLLSSLNFNFEVKSYDLFCEWCKNCFLLNSCLSISGFRIDTFFYRINF